MKRKFGPTASMIVEAAKRAPQNPWDYFGTSIRRSWAYAYFTRLTAAGLIKVGPTPLGRKGTWYVAA